MGVKSTRDLTREDAEGMYVSLMQDKMERKLRSQAVALEDKDLEDEIEMLNDAAHDGECYENYNIIG